jgi:hypothetical protein
MLQKNFNLVKEWARCVAFGVKGVWCLLMGDLKQIRISCLRSLIIASMPLEYNEVL